MKVMLARWVVVIAAFSLLAAGCSGGGSESSDTSYRNVLYDAFDLSTPEAGAQALADAYERRDFGTAYLLFDAQAQLVLIRNFTNSARYNEFWQKNTPIWLPNEHTGIVQTFEHFMLLAESEGTLQFDLADMKIDTARTGLPLADGRATQIVDATLQDGRSASLRMVESVSGRWRAVSLGVDEPPPSTEDQVVAYSESIPDDERYQGGGEDMAVVYPSDSFYSRLPLGAPDDAVAVFVDLYGSEDYLAATYVLSSKAQQRVAISVNSFNLNGVVADSEVNAEWFTGIDQREHAGAPLLVFQDILRDAGPDRLLIDLSGGIEITGTSEIQFEERDETLDGVLVEATSPNHPEGLGFVVVQSESGRWRIRQIASPASAAGDPDFVFISDR